MGVRGVASLDCDLLGNADGGPDDPSRRPEAETRQSLPSRCGWREAADSSCDGGLDVNRKTRRRLKRSLKKLVASEEVHMAEPWEAPAEDVSTVFMCQ